MYKSGPLSDLMGRLFDRARGSLKAEVSPEEYERMRFDFCFHMTDCDGDLHQLANLFKHPDSMDEHAALMLVMGCLSHIVPHINHAGILLLDDIPDPFAGEPKR